MTEAERIARGIVRKLMFENVANGVPREDIMAAFRRSSEELNREVAFVAKKIKEYRFRRRMPPLECSSEQDIRWNRKALLETLAKLGPLYLSSELLIPKITVQKVDHPSFAREAAHRVGARTNL